MTPGPASRMVTVLPRKSPTPIAPPIVIIVSWRCVSARLSSGEFSGEAASFEAIRVGEGLACLLTPNHVTEHLPELANLLDGVVVDKRRAVDTDFEAGAQALHQPRSIHVAVTNGNAAVSHCLCDERRRDVGKAETKRRNAFRQAGGVANSVNGCAGTLQCFNHLERQRGFIVTDRIH